MDTRRLAAFLLIVGAMAHPIFAYGGESTPRWTSERINWCYEPEQAPTGFDTKRVRKAIRAAMRTWSDEVDIPFSKREADLCDERTPDLIRVRWTYRVSDWTGKAITTSEQTMTRSGLLISERIISAEILLNEANLVENGVPLTDELPKVLIHEIGHAIGLDHSVDERSIMYPQARDDQELNSSDRSALRRLYGRRYEASPDAGDGRDWQARNR